MSKKIQKIVEDKIDVNQYALFDMVKAKHEALDKMLLAMIQGGTTSN